ncbi:ubiquitin-like domain-containing protein [Sporosarcina siberiensis]|uniref:Ubiquitin-like domain-containing protein n=1 Tax=Sporosarcina siberiensis TaxID=1365606 RepID=A0ABW4SBH9_9BACL
MSNRPMKSLFFSSLRSKEVAVTVLAFILFFTVITLVFYEGTKKSITLDVNGEELEIKTHAHTVADLLSEQDIDIAKEDLIKPSVNTSIVDGISIRWEQSRQVSILVDKDNKSIWTTKSTVNEVLEEAGIVVGEHDEVIPSLNEELADTDSITVLKAYEVTLNDGGKEKKYWTTSTTVADFLKKKDIQLSDLDRLEAYEQELVMPNSTVKIVRVEKVTDVVEEPANYAVETRSDSSLLKGREKVVQDGENGKVSRKFEVLKENGKEVSRKMVEETTIKQPKKKIVAIGTKVLVASASTTKSKGAVGVSRNNSAAPSGGKEFYVTATAYTAHCNGCSGITATGINLRSNPNLKVIAVDPSVIPLGSKVWVEGYGYAVAGDTGGAIKGMKIDLHVPTKAVAYKFGRRQVKIKVIN